MRSAPKVEREVSLTQVREMRGLTVVEMIFPALVYENVKYQHFQTHKLNLE